MTNAQLIQAFENDAFPGEFHHADHVRLAFAYLCEYPALEALENFCSALKRYAAARGQSMRYHETITYSLFFLIRERKARWPDHDWDTFESRNPELFCWKDGILSRYYKQSTLDSDLARSVFVLPDKLREL
jgi:hypothetical protein